MTLPNNGYHPPRLSHRKQRKIEKVELLQNGGFDILSALTHGPSTTKQLAMRFGIPRARVQYIVDNLIDHGLAYVHEEVQERDTVEVYYSATADDFFLAINEQAPEQTRVLGTQVLLDSLQKNLLKAVTTAPREGSEQPRIAVMKLIQGRLSSKTAMRFLEELESLARRFNEAEDKNSDEEYALSLALYPILDDDATYRKMQ